MQVKVKTLTGAATEFAVEPTDTVLSLKEKVAAHHQADVNQVRLAFSGRVLNNADTLEASRVRMVILLSLLFLRQRLHPSLHPHLSSPSLPSLSLLSLKLLSLKLLPKSLQKSLQILLLSIKLFPNHFSLRLRFSLLSLSLSLSSNRGLVWKLMKKRLQILLLWASLVMHV